MKLNLETLDNKLSTISARFAEKFMFHMKEALGNLSDILSGGFVFAIGMLLASMAVHVFMPEIGPDFTEFLWWAGRVAAFFLLSLFMVYITIKAGMSMEEVEQVKSINIFEQLNISKQEIDARPFDVIYMLPDETADAFSEKAIQAVKERTPVLIVGFRDPLVIILDAEGSEIRAFRGGMPWEAGEVDFDDVVGESYADYIEYVRAFVSGFRKHVRHCLASTTAFNLEDIVRPGCLPDKLPPNFANTKTLCPS